MAMTKMVFEDRIKELMKKHFKPDDTERLFVPVAHVYAAAFADGHGSNESKPKISRKRKPGPFGDEQGREE